MTARLHDIGPGISYYNGKGMTRADALAGAMMEAVALGNFTQQRSARWRRRAT